MRWEQAKREIQRKEGLEFVRLSVSHFLWALLELSVVVVVAAALTTKVAIKRHKICVLWRHYKKRVALEWPHFEWVLLSCLQYQPLPPTTHCLPTPSSTIYFSANDVVNTPFFSKKNVFIIKWQRPSAPFLPNPPKWLKSFTAARCCCNRQKVC